MKTTVYAALPIEEQMEAACDALGITPTDSWVHQVVSDHGRAKARARQAGYATRGNWSVPAAVLADYAPLREWKAIESAALAHWAAESAVAIATGAAQRPAAAK